jgi:hypothetical protein
MIIGDPKPSVNYFDGPGDYLKLPIFPVWTYKSSRLGPTEHSY